MHVRTMAVASQGPISSTKSSKVAERLEKKIEDGEYYEALQTYKALYSRYRAQGKDEEALDLVYGGAITLLQHEQWECGNDLALTVINFYKEKKTPITDETLLSISRLFYLYNLPPQIAQGADSIALRLKGLAEVTAREQFARAALKWSSIVGDEESCKYGHPKIHQMLARQYWREKQYPLSAEHFLYAEDPEKFSEMLVDFSSTYGYLREKDLFVVRAVLQLLVLHKPTSALTVYRHYIAMHPNLTHLRKTQPPYKREPTLNFAWFLLYSAVYLKEFTANVLNWIKRQYKGAINRDPSFSEYVEKIGTIYCGIPPEQKPEGEGLMDLLGGPGTGGVLDTLMSSLANPAPVVAVAEDQPQHTELENKALLDSDDVLD